MTTPNKEYNLTLMNNPNTEGAEPMSPPPLATYPLRSGTANTHPLTAARAAPPAAPQGPTPLAQPAL